jgi:hypothetical protein
MTHLIAFPLLIVGVFAIKACLTGAIFEKATQNRAQLPATPRRRFAYTSIINGKGII